MQAWQLAVGDYPTEPDGMEQVIVLHTEAGRVPYSLASNPRGRGAQRSLGNRFSDAGIVHKVTYEPPGPDADPFDDRHVLGHYVLCQALAEFEHRYCVADWCRAMIAGLMRR